MPSIKTSPPRLSTIYFATFGTAAVVTLIASFYLGAFRHEAHPDPTRGSIGLLLALVLGVGAFVISGALLLSLRWMFWPEGRSRNLGIQTIAFLVPAAYMIFSMLAPVLLALLQPTILSKQ